jgi:iron complex transport system ATP-binding protein
MIQLCDFFIGYDSRVLIEHANVTFNDGCLTALIGRNGTGKSTLLRAIAGLNLKYNGQILIDNNDIAGLQPQQLAKRLSFVTTERTRITNMRCEDIVAAGRAPYTNWIGRIQQIDTKIVYHALESVGMSKYAHRTMNTLSDGECQRIMIARALAQTTPSILLDEPTSFLDMPNRYELVILLRQLAHNENKCILFSTHELDVAVRMCDTIALIDNGTLYHLPVKAMIESGHIQRLFSTPDIDFKLSEL